MGYFDYNFDNVYKLSRELEERKYKLADEVLNNDNLSILEKLCVLQSADLYPIGSWYDNCPEDLLDWVQEFDQGDTIWFSDYFDTIEDEESEESIRVLHDVYEWIKEHKLIGTQNNW